MIHTHMIVEKMEKNQIRRMPLTFRRDSRTLYISSVCQYYRFGSKVRTFLEIFNSTPKVVVIYFQKSVSIQLRATTPTFVTSEKYSLDKIQNAFSFIFNPVCARVFAITDENASVKMTQMQKWKWIKRYQKADKKFGY